MCLASIKNNKMDAPTSGFLGEMLTVCDVASLLTFLLWFEEPAISSFFGEIVIFAGKLVVLLCCGSSLSSSLFFIRASLELVLTGAGLFLGDAAILWPLLDGLRLSTAACEQLCLRDAAVCSSGPLRAWWGHRSSQTQQPLTGTLVFLGFFQSPSLLAALHPASQVFWQIPHPRGFAFPAKNSSNTDIKAQ